AGYQVAFRYHAAGEQKKPDQPLAIQVAYERDQLQVGDVLRASVSVLNRRGAAAPMVMVDLPVPPGFTALTESFDRLVQDRVIEKYQRTSQSILLYLRSLPSQKALEFSYDLRASMPVRVTAPAARAYEYYDPDHHGHSETKVLVVAERR